MSIISDLFLIGILIFLSFLPGILIFLLFVRYAYVRKNIYKNILNAKFKFLQHYRLFPVYYSSEKRFQKIFKFIPMEAIGILCLKKNSVMFFGDMTSKKKQEILFNNNFNLEWIGVDIRNGQISWFVIIYKGKKYYFSAESGRFKLGSKIKTMNIYKALQKYHPRQHRITRGYAARKQVCSTQIGSSSQLRIPASVMHN